MKHNNVNTTGQEGTVDGSTHSQDRHSFSGKLGYILAAAGASVGLGNIWRFPYLAARYGGGIFLVIYILLAVTFGYTMIVAETVIGRRTRKSPVGAFRTCSGNKIYHAGGWVNAVIPMLIVPYYSTIGGWVVNYLVGYLRGGAHELAQDGYFGEFISNGMQTELWFLVFALCTLAVIFAGVRSGIERISRIMMPILVVLAVIVSIYSVTRPGALAGVKYFLIPDPKHFSWMTVVSAMEQMFYSLSIAMGILITFGSYMKDDVSIEKATRNVELFDTGIAVIAGLMIIPAVFAFSGGDASVLKAGPSLMFITIPKVLDSMGMSTLMGFLFFVVMGVIMVALGTLSCMGYGPWAEVKIIGMQFLDFFDFITNSVMMPIAAIFICLYVVRAMGLEAVEEEMTKCGATFARKKIFVFMIRFMCIIFLAVILISSILKVLGIVNI